MGSAGRKTFGIEYNYELAFQETNVKNASLVSMVTSASHASARCRQHRTTLPRHVFSVPQRHSHVDASRDTLVCAVINALMDIMEIHWPREALVNLVNAMEILTKISPVSIK